jgi:hypothetical protein
MKISIVLATCISVILLSACGRTRIHHIDPPVYSGKVVKSLCGNIMVQFTDDRVKFGQMGWEDPMDSGMVYDRVFSVANPCTWGKYDTTSNIAFRLIAPDPSALNCVMCQAYTSTPDTAYHIIVLQ